MYSSHLQGVNHLTNISPWKHHEHSFWLMEVVREAIHFASAVYFINIMIDIFLKQKWHVPDFYFKFLRRVFICIFSSSFFGVLFLTFLNRNIKLFDMEIGDKDSSKKKKAFTILLEFSFFLPFYFFPSLPDWLNRKSKFRISHGAGSDLRTWLLRWVKNRHL